MDDPAICIQRVRSRVLKGGHDVPTEDIIRRFDRSKRNFWDNFTILASDWNLFYNGEEGFQKVAVGDAQEFQIINKILFSIFTKK